MGTNTNLSPATVDVPTADLVQADKAAETVKANGGGDIAVYNARKAELIAIRDRSEKIAALDRDTALAKAAIWGGDRGAKMIANAKAEFSATVATARARCSSALAMFAVENNFLAMVGNDERKRVLGDLLQRRIEDLVTAYEACRTAGLTDVATRNGRTYVVSEELEHYAKVNALAAEATESDAIAA